MKTQTLIPPNEPTIIMTRIYDAARESIWEAITQAKHVRRWWGGPGFTNPVCEMDVRPGGLWTHVMRFPDAKELRLEFIFLEVERPARLVWQHIDFGKRNKGCRPAKPQSRSRSWWRRRVGQWSHASNRLQSAMPRSVSASALRSRRVASICPTT